MHQILCGKSINGKKIVKNYICHPIPFLSREHLLWTYRHTFPNLNMKKKITSALISVFYKEGLENIIKLLNEQHIKIYSTGGTKKFIEEMGIHCTAVESLTSYPSI